MLRLIKAELASARHRNRGYGTPALLIDLRALDTFRGERCDLGLKVIAHQVKLVGSALFSGVEGSFRGR